MSDSNVIRLRRKPRPLRMTYSPDAPYIVEREDNDDGSIHYIVSDSRPDSYRFICGISDDQGSNAYAKHDAEQIARGLNILVNLQKETLPKIRRRDEDEIDFDGDDL